MGKIRIKTLGTEGEEAQKAKQAEKRKQKKLRKLAKVKQAGKVPGLKGEEKEVSLERDKKKREVAKAFEKKVEDKPVTDREKKERGEEAEKEKKPKRKAVKKKAEPVTRVRSKRCQKVAKLVDPVKVYKLEEAVELVKKTSGVSFDESVEVHMNVTEKGVKTSLTFPYFTGKKRKVAICDEKVLAQIEKGNLDFDVLLAKPDNMAKLAKFAKILGPKGLMPNPKQGTITADPEKTKKEIEGGKQEIKTEEKAALIHTVIGKVSQSKGELLENLSALIDAVDPNKIEKMVLTSTMGPGIKVEVKV